MALFGWAQMIADRLSHSNENKHKTANPTTSEEFYKQTSVRGLKNKMKE